jgi:membrane-bound lytic murein transglycosylase MltF
VKKHGLLQSNLAKYHRRVKQIGNNTSGAEWKRFQSTVRLFEKYGARYNFDPLMLVAQGYQESKLRQEARSRAGAVGVMQIMPETGKELAVGDIHQIEPNIHAGAKYMNRLMTRYFADANFSEQERTLFAFASYNAGPGNIARMRSEAAKLGFDQDVWFDKCRDRHGQAHRRGDHDLRAQHLQVLRGVQARCGGPWRYARPRASSSSRLSRRSCRRKRLQRVTSRAIERVVWVTGGLLELRGLFLRHDRAC